MQEIEMMADRFRSAGNAVKTARAEALMEAGKELLASVNAKIGGTGRIQGVQDAHLGSGRGYVAVRAMAGEFVDEPRNNRYAAGYVTNSLENGHEIRTPSESSRRYVDRRKGAAVRGKHMYREAKEADADRIAAEVAQKISDAATNALNGGTT